MIVRNGVVSRRCNEDVLNGDEQLGFICYFDGIVNGRAVRDVILVVNGIVLADNRERKEDHCMIVRRVAISISALV